MEIDLILRDKDAIVFVEVKCGPDHDSAAARVTPHQIARLMDAGAEFLDSEPAGSLTTCRFDVALVDGQGRIDILENALAA